MAQTSFDKTIEHIVAGVRRAYPDNLIVVRLGDFYETSGEDAQVFARVCDLEIHRGVVGFPVAAADRYCQAVADAGYRVARIETPPGLWDAKRRAGRTKSPLTSSRG